ncbi:MAG: hypothetical protein ACJ8KU_05825 [Chthoniobacterales bacterium]
MISALKKLLTWSCFAVLCVAVAGQQHAVAGGRKKAKSTSAPQQPPAIIALGPSSITVDEGRGVIRTFTVTSFTEITLNGQRASLPDLKAGMTVDVSMGPDPLQARRITATGKPAGSAKTKASGRN